jgi:hypothetical protein
MSSDSRKPLKGLAGLQCVILILLLRSENSKPASETVDEKSIRKRKRRAHQACSDFSCLCLAEVEDSYTGPHLPTPITLEFVQKLMEHFAAQKTLHRK